MKILLFKKINFIKKVGKYSGARAVTVDGIRNIKIMQGRNKQKDIPMKKQLSGVQINYPLDGFFVSL